MTAQAPALAIVRVPVLADNYAWLVHDPATDEVAAIDPGEAQPVLDAAAARGWHVSQVWVTHWHADHIGGLRAMKAAGAVVTGPRAEAAKIESQQIALDTPVGDGDVVRIGNHRGDVLSVPGHTAGHIAFHFADDALAFSGDTLFAMGCGRLFEGSPADMHASLARFAAMPDDTAIYCGHEYTLANARFAATAEPGNAAIAARLTQVEQRRAAGEATVPTTIGEERATNPFLRAATADELGRLRAAKDVFRS